MANKHLAMLYARSLNEKNISLFDDFVHPDYGNHNRFVAPGRAGVKEFFSHWLQAFPDTSVTVEDVIEEGDRVSARFTYKGTFTQSFLGYAANQAPVEMRTIDIWRVQEGKFIEHWDEINSLEIFQTLGAAIVKQPGQNA